MKIYVISIFDISHFIEVHYCTSYEKAIEFILHALKDNNSGVEEYTLIDISVDILDEYFSKEAKSLERKYGQEFLK